MRRDGLVLGGFVSFQRLGVGINAQEIDPLTLDHELGSPLVFEPPVVRIIDHLAALEDIVGLVDRIKANDRHFDRQFSPLPEIRDVDQIAGKAKFDRSLNGLGINPIKKFRADRVPVVRDLEPPPLGPRQAADRDIVIGLGLTQLSLQAISAGWVARPESSTACSSGRGVVDGITTRPFWACHTFANKTQLRNS